MREKYYIGRMGTTISWAGQRKDPGSEKNWVKSIILEKNTKKFKWEGSIHREG